MNRSRGLVAVLAVGFLSRLIPHAWDFTPVLALTLFAGAHLRGRAGYLAPLGMMFLTDCVLGFYPSFAVTWIGVVAAAAIGRWVGEGASFARLTGGALSAALVFFVVSNFGVWAVDYPKTWAGLADCYLLALPFFKNSVVSTLVYSYALLGGLPRLAIFASAKRQKAII
jgi:hypothetical protein